MWGMAGDMGRNTEMRGPTGIWEQQGNVWGMTGNNREGDVGNNRDMGMTRKCVGNDRKRQGYVGNSREMWGTTRKCVGNDREM